ncbi:Receptor-like PK/ Leucine Rich Repeat Protein Kinase-likely pseudogene [Ectocarpus siliculosus]|nr:Receptor-like PK/ Leucine Rich Repeat Protein Kinase-likely pseudogene [Ectocarpus siliculosus]|eukprot:CBN77264.1 Receptor-like PK/ Leucine Rich Repeat Protein Kinase-likely pseudogene [Ectocarpus siliculosus]
MKARTNESSTGGASVEEVILDELLALSPPPPPPAFSPLSQAAGGSVSGNVDGIGPASRRIGRNDGNLLELKRVRFEGLVEAGHLGQGTFGEVLAGKYFGRAVAIKKARATVTAVQTLEGFRKEAEMHFVMRHDNIVELLAFSLGDALRPPCLVMERMQESLFGLLSQTLTIGFPAALGIVLDVCKALEFLHDYGMVHRNVKSPNVLLDSNGKAKLSDVNLAHISETMNANTGGGYHTKVGSRYWMAPEVYTHKIVSAPSDVFSLHVVMWEVVTNSHNWVGPPIGELLLRAPDARLSLDGSSSGPAPLMRRLQRLLYRCGSALSRERPTMKEITPEIAALCGHASATGSATTRGKIWTAAVEEQPRQQEVQRQAEAGAVAAIPGALGAAPATAVAVSSAARNGAWTERGSTGSGSWRENAEDTPKVALLSPYLFPVRRQQATFPAAAAATSRGGDVSPVGYQAHGREQLERGGGHQSVLSAAGVDGSGRAAVPATEAGVSHTAIGWGHHPAAAPAGPAAAAAAAAVTSTTARQEGLPDGDSRRCTPASCSSGEGDDSASGGSAGRPGFVLRQWLSKKPPPVHFPPGGGVNSAYSILATSGGGFQRRYATGVEGTNGNAATTKNALAGAAVFFGAARYVYGEETDGSDCDTDAGSAFGDDGSEVEDRGGAAAAAAVAGRGGSETAQGDDIAQWKNVLLSDAAAEDMWGIQTQHSGNEGGGMWAHREADAGVRGEQQHGQGGEQGLEGGLEEGDVEEETEEEGEEGKIMAGHKVMAPPPVAEPNQRGKHDRAILMELFDRCHGPTWVGSANWGSEEPLSAWYNVAVDRGGHVQRLTLPRNKLSGEIPSGLGMLAFLRDLRLHRNSLRGSIPPFIGGLSSLTYLDLHGNNLQGQIPKEIGNLPLLESLLLAQNKLSGEPNVFFPGLGASFQARRKATHRGLAMVCPAYIMGALVIFSIGGPGAKATRHNYVRIECPIPAEMGNLSRIRFISLQKNQLTGKIPRQLGKLAALQSLDLSFNTLEGSIPTEFGDLRALTELTVGGNRLTGAIPPELGNLSKLVLLELYDNQLSGSIPAELGNLTLLEHLAVAGNDLQGPSLEFRTVASPAATHNS